MLLFLHGPLILPDPGTQEFVVYVAALLDLGAVLRVPVV